MARDDHYASLFGVLFSAYMEHPLRGRDSLRQRLLVRPGTGDFGPVGTQGEVGAWLEEAGFALSSQRRADPMLYFEGSSASTRPSSTAARSDS